jgi:hypothetical protein
MFGDSGHANNNMPRERGWFKSFKSGTRPKRFWLAMVVIALIGASGLAFLLMFQS